MRFCFEAGLSSSGSRPKALSNMARKAAFVIRLGLAALVDLAAETVMFCQNLRFANEPSKTVNSQFRYSTSLVLLRVSSRLWPVLPQANGNDDLCDCARRNKLTDLLLTGIVEIHPLVLVHVFFTPVFVW